MTSHCEEQRDKTIQRAGSPRLLVPTGVDLGGRIVAATRTRTTPRAAKAPRPQLAELWRVVVLNDPVNRMSYVVMVLRRVFGFAEERARKHMLEIHEKGRSVLWSGTREQAEAYVFALQQWHLTALVQAEEPA
jgi:ATP-dependent Clp protease adaptor protein ClpS